MLWTLDIHLIFVLSIGHFPDGKVPMRFRNLSFQYWDSAENCKYLLSLKVLI
ncbi:hypothetical protein JCM18905_2185 [Vibrio sp. JCM 18905]|nr:hypothetical protein JCM18905_2185 [Vibrio sp. JCM 18905]